MNIFRFCFQWRICKESYKISYLYHFRDSLGLPLTVLCHTTGKLVQLAKFCVMAMVVSRLRTTCHQPPKTQHQWPLVAARQRARSRTAKNTFPTVQVQLDIISQTQVSLPTPRLSSVLFQLSPQCLTGSCYRRQLHALTELLSSHTALKMWPDSTTLAADSLFTSNSHCNPDCTEALSVQLQSTFHADFARFLWLQTNLSFKNRCKIVSPHGIKIVEFLQPT